jgi:YHS domain-containing protein
MKKIFKQARIPLAIALFFFAAGLIFAADCGDMVKCAVCGKEMKKADAKITYVYKEKTYYFASEKCKEAFVKEPEKFLQAKCCMKEMVCCAVCGKGMKKADAKITYVYKDQTYYFASEKCKEAFVKEPEKFLKTVFACPMHPEATADKPGKCPKCGMDMKRKTVACGMKTHGCCHMMMKGHKCDKGKEGCAMKNKEGGCEKAKSKACEEKKEQK